jgi:outer membrane usher protein
MPSNSPVSPKRCFLGIILTVGLLLHSPSHATEEIVLKVIVNTVPKEELFVLLTSDQDIQIAIEDFKKLGIIVKDTDRYTEVGEKKYVSLKSLDPDLRFTLNETELTLEIDAHPDRLGKTTLDLHSSRFGGAVSEYLDGNSAFVNYAALYTTGEDFGDFGTFDLSTEIGMRFMGFLSLGTFFYRRNQTEERFVRLNNSIIRDDTDNLRRVILGDSIGTSGFLASGALMGGITVAKAYSIAPHFIRHPLPRFQGMVESPSEVEVLRHGFVVQEEQLPPGSYLIENIPVSAGLGQYDIVIRDAFGRETRVSRSHYLDARLLKKGLHDYSFSFGFEREAFGIEDFQYGDPVFLAFHNYGFSDRFNGGFSAEASKDLTTLGPQGSAVLGRAGLLSLAAAYSNAKGENGASGILAYSFSSKRFSTSLSMEAFSSRYRNFARRDNEDTVKFDTTFGLSLGLGLFGSVSGEVSSQKMYSSEDTRKFSVTYTRQMTRDVNLFLNSTTTRGSEPSDRFFAGLHVNLGRGVTGSLNHTTDEDGHRETLKYQKNLPDIEGLGYRISVDRVTPKLGEGVTQGNTFLQYNGRYHIYTAEYQRSAEQDSGIFSLAGGIATIGESVYLGRPINRSFALVKAGKLEGVGVKFNNQKVGSTNSSGEFLLPNLLSFHDNQIEIENKDIPVNYSIERVIKKVNPPFRGGVVVDFNVQKLQAFIGTFIYVGEGKKQPLESGELKLWVFDKVIKSFIGKDGEFYLENIPPGNHKGTVSSKTGECSVHIIIPESDEMMVDLGNITCEKLTGTRTSDNQGKMPPSNILSAQDNKAEIENRDMSLNDKVESAGKQTTPSFGEGQVLNSKPPKHHEVMGTISYMVKGVSKTVEFKRVQIGVTDKTIELPMGKDGEFYIESILPGKYKGRISSTIGECTTQIIIPESNETLLDLGRVTCEGAK